MEIDDPHSKLRKTLHAGSAVTGAAVGASLGAVAAGPLGGALGAMAGVVLEKVGSEAIDRLLGPRERSRIGIALAVASTRISDRMSRGEALRSDGFFDENSSGRSDAEEIAESALLKCQREPEEKKITYISNLLANICFDPTANAGFAHQLLKLADILSYRQYCILKLCVTKSSYSLRPNDYRESGRNVHEERALYDVLNECLDLERKQLIRFGIGIGVTLHDVSPGEMELQGLGTDLYHLMNLEAIPPDDITSIAEVLS
jgi:hypothetical protein